MAGYSHVKICAVKTKLNRQGREKKVPCGNPNRWVEKMRRELVKRDVVFNERPYQNGVLFAWS
jgi:hypothetical protein